MNIKDKKISILGAVRSGIGAAKLAKQFGAYPVVSDSGNPEKLDEAKREFEKNNIDYEFGNHTEKVFDCDFIVTSPGVPSDSDILVKAKSKGIKVYSEVEFASWFCEGTVASITGSNGKTTTTALLNHVVNESGLKCYEAGNIGYAFSEISSRVNIDEFVSLETSSFQLDHIDSFKPKFALILNITPDHLDRYENDFEKYKAAKFRVFENQMDEDILIINADDPNLKNVLETANSQIYSFSTKTKVSNGAYLDKNKLIYEESGNAETVCNSSDLYIKGEHNIANALAVLIVAKKIALDNSSIKNGFITFKGVEHRLEFVREINGIKFINDSKATNVDSVWYALKSFDQPILLILGGKDKGNDYSKIKSLVKERVRKIYAIGSSKDKVMQFFSNEVEVEQKRSLEESVLAGFNEAKENEVVLLSPACASFDMFDDYEHRGKVFKDAVMSLN